MKKQVILGVMLIVTLLSITGCFSGTGFNKSTTLIPDSVGISFGQERYKGEDAAWRGISINAQWNLK